MTTALLVALTGGIGAGKSTVAHLLEAEGARLIDADKIAREVVMPSADHLPLLQAIARLLGDQVFQEDGSLDRRAVADRVFSDDGLRQEYNDLIHPAIRAETARRIDAERQRGGVIVHEVPLLSRNSKPLPWTYDVTVTVEADATERAFRLCRDRGFDSEEAWRRIRAQGEEAGRIAIADVVLRTDGDRTATAQRTAELWDQLMSRTVTPPDSALR